MLLSLPLWLVLVGCEEEPSGAMERVVELEKEVETLRLENLQLNRVKMLQEARQGDDSSLSVDQPKEVIEVYQNPDYEQLMVDYEALLQRFGPLNDLADEYATRLRKHQVGKQYQEIRMMSGNILTEVTVVGAEGEALKLRHLDGIGTYQLSELPIEIQRDYFYRPAELETVKGMLAMNPDFRAEEEARSRSENEQAFHQRLKAKEKQILSNHAKTQREERLSELIALETALAEAKDHEKRVKQYRRTSLKKQRAKKSKIGRSRVDVEKLEAGYQAEILQAKRNVLALEIKIEALQSAMKD